MAGKIADGLFANWTIENTAVLKTLNNLRQINSWSIILSSAQRNSILSTRNFQTQNQQAILMFCNLFS